MKQAVARLDSGRGCGHNAIEAWIKANHPDFPYIRRCLRPALSRMCDQGLLTCARRAYKLTTSASAHASSRDASAASVQRGGARGGGSPRSVTAPKRQQKPAVKRDRKGRGVSTAAKQGTDARRLVDLCGVGKAMVRDFLVLGCPTVASLRDQDATTLYYRICDLTGQRHDPCVHDVYACAIAQANNPSLPPEECKWWTWSSRRKAAGLKLVWPRAAERQGKSGRASVKGRQRVKAERA